MIVKSIQIINEFEIMATIGEKRRHSQSSTEDIESELYIKQNNDGFFQMGSKNVEKFYKKISLNDTFKEQNVECKITQDEIIDLMIKMLIENEIKNAEELKTKDDLFDLIKNDNDLDIYQLFAYALSQLYSAKLGANIGDLKLIQVCLNFIDHYKKNCIEYYNKFKNCLLSNSTRTFSIKKPKFLQKKVVISDENVKMFDDLHATFSNLHNDLCSKVSFASQENIRIASFVEKSGKFNKVDNVEDVSDGVEFTFAKKLLFNIEQTTHAKTSIVNIAENEKGFLIEAVNRNINCTDNLNISNIIKMCSYKDIQVLHPFDKFKISKSVELFTDSFVLVSGFQMSTLLSIGNFAPQNIIKIYPIKLNYDSSKITTLTLKNDIDD